MNHLVANLYRWSWGRWRVSEARCKLLQQALVIYLNVEQWAHWLPIQERTNQLCHVIMMSLCQIELDLSDCTIKSFMPELIYRFYIFVVVVFGEICTLHSNSWQSPAVGWWTAQRCPSTSVCSENKHITAEKQQQTHTCELLHMNTQSNTLTMKVNWLPDNTGPHWLS